MNNSPVSTGFHRTLINDNLQVRSICKKCEFVITSSVRDGLAEVEGDHISECMKIGRYFLKPPVSHWDLINLSL
jgi:hypothetical protein